MFDEDQPENDELAEQYREPDPETDLPDPESELPSVPSVEVPAPDPGEVPDELLRGFWSLVLLFNAAFLVVAVGVLMVAFDVERPLGVLVALFGLLLVRRGYGGYRTLDERHRRGELSVDGGAEADTGGGADAGAGADTGGGADGGTDAAGDDGGPNG